MSTILISSNREATFTGPGYGSKSSGKYFFATLLPLQGVSILLHIGLLLLMIFMQQHTDFNRKMPPAVQVDLVSYSPKLGDLLKSQPKKTKKPDVPAKPKPVKKKVKPIKKNEKVFSEKKEPEPAKVVETAKEDIAKEVEEPENSKIRDLLSELRDKVAEQEMNQDYEKEEITQTQGYKGWRKDFTAISIYNGILTAKVQENFVFNKALAKLGRNDKKLIVRVMIKIMKNGELTDIWIETKSGNAYLDRQAVKAIKRAAPFPELPKGYSSYNLGFDITDRGLLE